MFASIRSRCIYFRFSKKIYYLNQNDNLSNREHMITDPGELVFFNGNSCHGGSKNKLNY